MTGESNSDRIDFMLFIYPYLIDLIFLFSSSGDSDCSVIIFLPFFAKLDPR